MKPSIKEGLRKMETQNSENPRVSPQNPERENVTETKKENNAIETPKKEIIEDHNSLLILQKLIVNSTDRC